MIDKGAVLLRNQKEPGEGGKGRGRLAGFWHVAGGGVLGGAGRDRSPRPSLATYDASGRRRPKRPSQAAEQQQQAGPPQDRRPHHHRWAVERSSLSSLFA